MKLNNLVKALPLVLGASIAFNANAGVVATSYLEINNLAVEIDVDKDGQADAVDPTSFIAIAGGSREGNTNANFNGTSAGDAVVAGPIGAADAALVCVGPDCGGLGLVNNGQSFDLGNLVHDDTQSYAVSDENVSGSALGAGASGFTYGDVGIDASNAIGSASSQIFNQLIASLTLTVTADINLRFTALYDYFVDAIISADIAADNAMAATASAEASFDIDLTAIAGTGATIDGSVTNTLDDGINFTDFAIDLPGLGDLVTLSGNDQSFESAWVTLTAGTYQLQIAQDSDVQASLIPEPASLGLLGLGLMALGFRNRKAK